MISLIALFFTLNGWGYAATGGSFILGTGNSARGTTSLTSSAKKGPALVVKSTGGKPAASFTVKSGTAPFSVNSGEKVARLNADSLDGSDAADFYRSGSKVADSDQLDGADSAAFQRRVTTSCGASSALRVINPDGTATCQPFWAVGGNAGATGFLGTTDTNPFVIRTNNSERLRIDPQGNIGIGTATPGALVEVAGHSPDSSIGLMSTHDSRAVIGRLGVISCPGTYGVGGCAGSTPGASGVEGRGLGDNIGVAGSSETGRAVQGFSESGIGVIGDSTTRGVIGTLGRTSCAGTYGVGGCGGSAGDGVLGRSTSAFAIHAYTETGQLFVGSAGNPSTQVARIDATGKGFFNGGTQTGGADYAESIAATTVVRLEPGDVLAMDPNRTFAVRKSRSPTSTLVAGVYSTKPAVLAVGKHRVGDSLAGEVPVAFLGVVPTKVSSENGRVHAGDLLVTARAPGYAMKARPLVVRGVPIYPAGAILGKALQPLKTDRGVIKVLLMQR